MKQRFSITTGWLIYIVITVLISFSACKVPAIQGNPSSVSLPSVYPGVSDSTNSSDMVWKQFYHSEPLLSLIDTVMSNNQDLLISLEKIEYAKAHFQQASGLLLPQVNGVVSPSLRKFGLYTMDGAGNSSTDMEPGKRVPVDLPDFYIGFQSSWEADLWGKLKDRKRASLSRTLAAGEYTKLIRSSLVAETAITYYDLLAADQEIRTLDQTIELQREALELIRVQKEAAVVNELAVKQFEAQLLGMQGLRLQLAQRIIESENKLSYLAGRPLPVITRDSLFFQSQPLPVLKTGIPGQLLVNRPDIRQTELELLATKADLRAARAAFLPSLQITGNLGLQGYLPGKLVLFPEAVAYNLMGGLTGPLLNKRNIKGEFAKISAQQKEAFLQYQKTILRGFLEVDQEMKKSNNLYELMTLKKQEANVLSNAVEIAAELFKTGRSNYLEVLFARQHQLRVNLELIETKKAQWVSSINLYKALGGGWK